MAKNTFDGKAMSIILDMLPDGAEKITALKEYIKEADEAGGAYYQLIWRYDYAYQAYFYGDPVSAMPVASEFTEIYEADPHALDSVPENGGAEAYLMITQMGLDNVVALPQVPMKEWEDMMDRFHALVKRLQPGIKYTGGSLHVSGSISTKKKHTGISRDSGKQAGTGFLTAGHVNAVMQYICLYLQVTEKQQTNMQNH